MFDSYEDALNNRRNWVNPFEFGEVTYVGDYCVITGTPGGEDSPYGRNLPQNSAYIGIIYYVGSESIADSDCERVGMYQSEDELSARLNHELLVDQASRMDLLEFSHSL